MSNGSIGEVDDDQPMRTAARRLYILLRIWVWAGALTAAFTSSYTIINHDLSWWLTVAVMVLTVIVGVLIFYLANDLDDTARTTRP